MCSRQWLLLLVHTVALGIGFAESADQKMIEVRPELVEQLGQLEEVPHKLHIFWPNKTVVDDSDEMVVHGIRKMIDLNPGWSLTVYEHVDIDAYLKKELTRKTPIISQSDVDLMMEAHIVERTDAARLLIMWHEGGFYQDVDRIYNVPMSEVVTPGVKMVIQTLYDGTFMQDQMCTAPHNPVVMRAIEIAWEMRRKAVRVKGLASFTDHMQMVNSWTLAINDALFNNRTVPLRMARAAIKHVPALKTYNEEWCDGLWIRPYEGCKGVSRAKLYEKYGIYPWGYHVKHVWTAKCTQLRKANADQKTLDTFQCDNEYHKVKVRTTVPPIDNAVIAACEHFTIQNNHDVNGAMWIDAQPAEGHQARPRVCCGLCEANPKCEAWVVQPSTNQCWLMKRANVDQNITTRRADDRVCGILSTRFSEPETSRTPARSGPIEVGPVLRKTLETLPPIPKKLHIIFPNKNVVGSQDPMVLHGIRKMIDMNPEWSYTVYDHDAVDAYIRDELTRDKPTLSERDVQLVLKAHIVERTDAARLLMMWHEGGFYQDVDRLYNVPMTEVLTDKVKMVIPTLYNANFMQDLMCTAPGNPVVKRAIAVAWEWRRKVPRVDGISNFFDHMMMVNSWSMAISLELFGRAEVKMELAREAIGKVPELLTYKEEWCDGLWIKNWKGCKEVTRLGLYEAYNIVPWGNEVKDLWKAHCTKIVVRHTRLKQSTTTSVLKEKALERLKADWKKFTCFRPAHLPAGIVGPNLPE